MPDLFDLHDILAAEAASACLASVQLTADAQAAGHELIRAKRPDASRRFEPALDEARATLREAACNVSTTSARRGGCAFRPEPASESDRLGEIADIVVRVSEEHARPCVPRQGRGASPVSRSHRKVAGQRGEAIAAIGIGRGAEIVGEQPELAVTGGRQDETVEKAAKACLEAPI